MNAIILAGGRGSRLAPWHAPKCLLPINGVPILFRLLDHLFESRIKKVVVCTGYRSEDIYSVLEETEEFIQGAVKISDADEDAPMGARLLEARKLTDGGRVLICYADELADVDIWKLVQQHKGTLSFLTFAVARASAPGGALHESPLRIVDEEARWVNIGFAVVEPECWALLKPEDGLSDWINRVSSEHGRVSAYYHEGKRATVNTLADIPHAEEVWK